ncbi:MarR family transcriptional regulator [Thiorhodospira sibirica]|uniref:MarR family transcriptional regulator n=1 Tax=Thiorhodospira sibirica TaxID=154347 RepID=UPI00022C11DC|nr:helix-turn-helix domain-containing protein [Thiorhodospira sibirica]
MTVKKVDILRRLGFIEIRVLWAGGVTAGELAQAFGLSRQAAQAVINEYKRQMPGNLKYDASLRRHVAAQGFKPGFIREGSSAFLDYLRGQGLVAQFIEDIDWSEIPFCDANRATRPKLNNDMVSEALQGLYRKKAVAIRYSSKYRTILRTISPHCLVFADNRYHLRAYCHTVHKYMDFALSRILFAGPSNEEWVSGDADRAWHQYQDLCFQVGAELSAEKQTALREDYKLTPGQVLTLRTKQALAFYCERELLEKGFVRCDEHALTASPHSLDEADLRRED